MERDEKLRLRFAKEKAEADAHVQASNRNNTFNSNNNSDDDDVVCVEMSRSTEDLAGARMETCVDVSGEGEGEWQDVDVVDRDESSSFKDNNNNNKEDLPSPSALGISLSQAAIADMSHANILVRTPVAALALALHASLRSDILGFKCTGVPEEDNCFSSDPISSSSLSSGEKRNSGFAPPVRELPKGKFLPDGWDKFASTNTKLQTPKTNESAKVTLRYRKNGIGATILRVIQIVDVEENNYTLMARICFGPSGGEPLVINIPMDRYVNVDGLNAALDKCPRVKPALHYKSLPLLLSDFCKRADLGVVKEKEDVTMNTVTVNVGNTNTPSSYTTVGRNADDASRNLAFDQNRYGSRPTNTRPTIEDDLLGVAGIRGQRMPGGDFAGDILPGGIPGPGFANPRPGGSLMGPNHPYFQGNFDGYGDNDYTNSSGQDNFPGLGGLGMQPRFDPYYPPGVNTGRGGRGRGGVGGRGRGRGGGRGNRDFSGDPNPDHERPPNTFGNDMFM